MILVRNPLAIQDEVVNDFQYVDHKSILMPSSKILIGTRNTLEDAVPYYAPSSLVMDLTLGVANLGLDAGAEVANQWYAVYAVPGSNGSYGLRFSAQAPHQAGGIGPTGFTKYRYLGLVRNGTNTWDAPNGSYGNSDIVNFTKIGNRIDWNSFSTNNAAAYPSAIYAKGIMLYATNTSTNGMMINVDTATYLGYAGLNPQGQSKLPYRKGKHGLHMVVNPGDSTSSAILRDSTAGNDRGNFNCSQMSVSVNFYSVHFEVQFSDTIFATSIYSAVNNNANCSRVLALEHFTDPYILGGK